MELDVAGKLVLLVGPNEPVGQTCARRLADEGCDLALADKQMPGLRNLASQLKTGGSAVTTHVMDVTKPNHIDGLFDAIDAPPIVVAFLSSSAIPDGFEPVATERWARYLRGQIYLCRTAVQVLSGFDEGVFIAVINEETSATAQQRSALAALRTFYTDQGKRQHYDDPRVLSVSVGPEADICDPASGVNEDLADLIVFLASVRALQVSGTSIYADGGLV